MKCINSKPHECSSVGITFGNQLALIVCLSGNQKTIKILNVSIIKLKELQ